LVRRDRRRARAVAMHQWKGHGGVVLLRHHWNTCRRIIKEGFNLFEVPKGNKQEIDIICMQFLYLCPRSKLALAQKSWLAQSQSSGHHHLHEQWNSSCTRQCRRAEKPW